jgi:putative ATP-dependent endonuclease of the OLD family
MRLTTLSVTNHSRLADFTMEVRKHLVLVGPNDVGKSSLLRCVDLLLGASTAALYARLDISDLRDATLPLVIEGTLEDFGADDRALFPDEIDIAAATGLESMRIRLEVTADADQTLDMRRTAPTNGTKRQLSRDQVAGLKWRMLGAIGSSRDLRDDRRNPLDDILQAVDLGAEKADFEALAQQLETKLSGSPALEALRDQLAGQLTKALPDAVDKSDLAFVPGARIDGDALSDIRLQVTRGGVPRGLMDQSDGTRALFAMAMYDLVSASANIVGIDEPEIHLHPTSQPGSTDLMV